MERLASFISGGGTTMEQIVLAVQSGEIPDMEMACVIASKEGIDGIKKANNLGVPTIVVDQDDFRMDGKIDRGAFGERILEVVDEHDVTVVTQNGWLPLTPKNVINRFSGPKKVSRRIFNQHPGPPEHFGGQYMMGTTVHAVMLEYQRLAGRIFDTSVIAQYVDPEFDKGAVVKRIKVPVLPDDTVETLQNRALPMEHRVQIELLQSFVRGELTALEPEMLVPEDEKHLLEQAKRTVLGEKKYQSLYRGNKKSL